jgi:hypothetical protein
MYNYTAHASDYLPKEGNSAERKYPALRGLNNISRGISKVLNTIGDAFSGGYSGAGQAVQNAHPAAQASLAVASTIVVAPFAYLAGEYVVTNPVQAYQFTEGALNTAVTVGDASSKAGRLGQAVGWTIGKF